MEPNDEKGSTEETEALELMRFDPPEDDLEKDATPMSDDKTAS